MAPPPETKPFQFRLRTVFVVLFIYCLAMAFLPRIWWFLADMPTRISSAVSLCLFGPLSFTVGSRLARLSLVGAHSTTARATFFTLFVIATCLTGYTIWLRDRAIYGWTIDPSWPRPWPYPDAVIADFHDWLDNRNPPPPGVLKIHGEWYRVRAIADVVALILVCTWGALFGLACPQLPQTIRSASATQRLWQWLKINAFVRLLGR